ncbi:hypothetical protein [Providencia alcalifaciens]|nr:hypothetical protein NVI2019_KOLGMIGM_04079 [Providencia alcalifaciens]CAG9436777.1 hypothetical protein NVI2019_PLFLNFOB_04077 [Providencia alcalifaciens]CAG9436803.1 hypothetical protein NVI2019_ANGEOOBF_04078 [Providencia alcalifaciens]CAG9436817.1 hypothetical protein NVI2019_OGMBKCAO_04092 [Providencia alcalifaciens]CAG9437587.1 hypothetical protein NVI2019_OHEONHNH_04077 [Providencia alcalifaciens]
MKKTIRNKAVFALSLLFYQMSPIHQKKRITLMRLRFILRYLNAASM